MSFLNLHRLVYLIRVSERQSGQLSSAPRHMAKVCQSSEVQIFRRLHHGWTLIRRWGSQETAGPLCAKSADGCTTGKCFFHNHLRDVHGIPMKKLKRTSMGIKKRSLLETYYYNVCKRTTLEEVENVTKFFWISKTKLSLGGSWIRTNDNVKFPKVSSERNKMSMGRDVLIEFLLELLKKERDQRRRETEENASLIKDLMTKFEKMERVLILQRHL